MIGSQRGEEPCLCDKAYWVRHGYRKGSVFDGPAKGKPYPVEDTGEASWKRWILTFSGWLHSQQVKTRWKRRQKAICKLRPERSQMGPKCPVWETWRCPWVSTRGGGQWMLYWGKRMTVYGRQWPLWAVEQGAGLVNAVFEEFVLEPWWWMDREQTIDRGRWIWRPIEIVSRNIRWFKVRKFSIIFNQYNN